MRSPEFVSLSVISFCKKTTNQIFMIILSEMYLWTRKN